MRAAVRRALLVREAFVVVRAEPARFALLCPAGGFEPALRPLLTASATLTPSREPTRILG
jgi:hypothetical protein